MTAALDLADQGFGVYLLEQEGVLGGNLRHISSTLKGEDTVGILRSLVARVHLQPRITLHVNAQIRDITGYIGNFKTVLDKPQEEIEHGVVIVASGAEEYQPNEYLYGSDDRVITQRGFEEWMQETDTSTLRSLGSVVMIQCVGSRDDERPYCSRVCCSHAVKNAIRFKEINPKTSVYILFRDIRTYGLRESFYRTARDRGVIFIRYDEERKPELSKAGEGLEVTVMDEIIGKRLVISPDLLVLSAGIVPNPQNKELSQYLKVPLDADGFFLEAHVKLRPVDFATDGIFVCGLAHYPKDISETIAQARAASGRAATVLSKDRIEAEGKVSYIREDRCSGCGACVEVCAYNAIELEEEYKIARVNEALCKGCGACSATCRAAAIDIKGFRNEQILEAMETL